MKTLPLPSNARRLLHLSMVIFAIAPIHADDWPQWLGPLRDGVWRESGILEKFGADGPKVRWRAPIGAGYTGPAGGRGRGFLMGRPGAPGAGQTSQPVSPPAKFRAPHRGFLYQ